MVYKNTKLESEGAEFLVLGNLLINGVEAYIQDIHEYAGV